MIDWSTRPFEERNLFNPAFCALVLAAAIREYERVARKPMPYSLTLLVLPLCLHLAARDQILNSKKRSILRIVAVQPELLVDFAERARLLVQSTSEAFALLASKGCIEVSSEGGIHLIPRRVAPHALSTDDAEMCRTAATTLGRDFAKIDDRATIYTSLSIRP
ncbi:three component ABC system middle component [Achromobacter xylosoxidans]